MTASDRDRVASILADALMGAKMLRPVISRIRKLSDEDEIHAIVNAALISGQVEEHQLPLLAEGLVA